jgi:hypothetical protein
MRKRKEIKAVDPQKPFHGSTFKLLSERRIQRDAVNEKICEEPQTSSQHNGSALLGTRLL